MTRWQAALYVAIAVTFGFVGGSCASSAVTLAGESFNHPHPRGVCVWYAPYAGSEIGSPELGLDGTVSCRQGRFVSIEPQHTIQPGP